MKDLGSSVALAAVLLLAIFAMGVIVLAPLKAHADSRFYPYAELSYRFESAKEPRPWASLGCPMSFGRLAPSASIGIAPAAHGEPWAVRGDLTLRLKLGH